MASRIKRPGIVEQTGAEFQRIVDAEEVGLTAPSLATNQSSTAIPPRPTGVSEAPRPQTIAERDAEIRSFVTDPQAEKFRQLREAKTVSQRRAVEAQFDPATPAAERGAEAMAAREAKQFEQQIALKGEEQRVKGVAAENLQTLKNNQAEIQDVRTDEFKRAELKQAQTEAILGREQADRVTALKARTDVILEQIRQTGKETPIQKVNIARSAAIDEQRDNLEGDIIDLSELLTKTTDAGALDIIDRQIEKKRSAFEPLEKRQTEILKALEDGRGEAIDGLAGEAEAAVTGFEAGAEVGATAGAEAVGDLNGDGTPNDADDIKANKRIVGIRNYEALQKANPSDARLTANNAAAKYERAKIEQAEWAKGIKTPKV